VRILLLYSLSANYFFVMKIVSFDVGIVNLAYCVVELKDGALRNVV
jgi:hypothetical protein